ncbi:methyltransferase [Bowmanella denitrificans]|uniref:methyltransferase n=1 Tax=Bowmanella denitrificans TaxID=366582 RepID=UPI000C9B1C7B|nr:methyltransferase [Bowmanella denitrificans]
MLAASLRRLDRYLTDHCLYWQFSPFAVNDYPWRQQNPALAQWLDELPDEQLASWQIHAEQALLACSRFLPELMAADALYPLQKHQQSLPAPFWLQSGIKGRKWQQISAFAALFNCRPGPILEWCAGKGHLGRLLAWQFAQPVISVEWQAELCQQGQQVARQQHVNQRFVCADVLKDKLDKYVQADQQLVALHACGQLHIKMLQEAVKNRVQAVYLCPCCYQLITQETYQPLSQAGQCSQLQLSRADLRLAVQETVTAPHRDQHKRLQERLYRQMFDIWQRQHLGQDNYLPVPSAPDYLFRQPPQAFLQWAAQQKGLVFAPAVDLSGLEMTARQRLRLLERMELVRHLFRRALELWLVLDRSLYLEEHAYHVQILEFCTRQITPRNLVIVAQT